MDEARFSPIEDYALIGNLETAALVSRHGSIDWLCLPHFDSGACFAALLGGPECGRWQICPEGEFRSERRYVDDTLVLETEFTVDAGRALLRDAMVIDHGRPILVRTVTALEGRVPLRAELVLRFDYGSIVPWVRQDRRRQTLLAVAGIDAVRVRTRVPMQGENFKTLSRFTLAAGESESFVLDWHPSHEAPPPRVDDPEAAVARTTEWWRGWAGRCDLQCEFRPDILRSLITLKALTFAPTGGIVAAPTTSLPEWLGGSRNWDYRFCWLRDATFTLYSLLNAGYLEESLQWRDWLVRAVAGAPAQLNIMYGLRGERRLPEITLPWLSGYENSSPVRTGNGAWSQLQLDIFGEVMDTLHLARKRGLPELEVAWRLQIKLLDFLQTQWEQPDEGIWEIRGPRRHFVHSKVMAWVAFDRGIKAIEHHGLEGPLEAWRAIRERIHAEVCARGVHEGRFAQHYGSAELDASLLMIPIVGFLPPHDARVQATVRAIERDLTVDGFVRRYRAQAGVDGLRQGEGVFLPCSFWLVDNLLLQGRDHDACALFRRLLALRNDVGLLSEEYDPGSRRLLGNFPQALSHIALLNSAYNITQREGPARERARNVNGRGAHSNPAAADPLPG